MEPGTALVFVKLAHTAVWAFFVACIVGVPAAALRGRLRLALALSALVWAEIAVLAANDLRCPLTDVAMRYTVDRGDAFDIYLPGWLARNNKAIFGTVFLAGEVVLVWCWRRRRTAPSTISQA